MFLAGLKFALGLVTGLGLLAGLIVLTFVCMDLFTTWRKKHRPRMWEPKARSSQRAIPRFRERAVFQFSYRSDDWIPVPDKSEHTQ